MMKKLRSLFLLLLPLVGFIAILVVLNGYQYLRIRADLAAGFVTAIGENERDELRSFFAGIEGKLQLVRQWGKNDVLVSGDITSLNKKFVPLLEQQDAISAILIANDLGHEYILAKDNGNYLTCVSDEKNDENSQRCQEWSAADTPGRKWQENRGCDPRARPWFYYSPSGNKVHWSAVYSFSRTKEQGVTASVSWDNPGGSGGYTVFGMDIPLSGIKRILEQRSADRPGLLFLVSGEGTLVIASQKNEIQTGSTREDKDVQSILDGLVKQWQAAGNPDGALVKMAADKKQWLAVFQQLEHGKGTVWLGLAASESELLGRVNRELYMVDFYDLGIAAVGTLLILLFMGKRGFFQRSVTVPPEPRIRLQAYISEGEGSRVEFKSTIRTNLKTGAPGKEIELAWLKAVAAFLNSDGGCLLLGVADSGEICGVGVDGFESSDRCLLHVKNLLNQHIGAEFSGFMVPTVVECREGPVVMLECRPAGAAVFLKIGKNEEFYVRSGPSSTRLSPSQTVSYMAEKKR